MARVEVARNEMTKLEKKFVWELFRKEGVGAGFPIQFSYSPTI